MRADCRVFRFAQTVLALGSVHWTLPSLRNSLSRNTRHPARRTSFLVAKGGNYTSLIFPHRRNLLAEIANMHGMPKGAFNVRKDGELVERHSSAYIDISTKTDNPGIDIRIADGTKGETVYIPVIVTKSGLKDVVYNTFYVGENCDITIIAGCGIHNDSHDASEHDGIHSFYLGKNSRVRYVEKHYGEGEGTGERILNPTTNVYMEEGSSCEMEMVQLRGVTSTVRDTNAELGARTPS